MQIQQLEYPIPLHCTSQKTTMAISILRSIAWATRPERPKGVRDKIKQARRAANKKSEPGGPQDL